MTVSPTYNTITYTANGTTTDFPWTYDYDPTYGALVVKNTTDDITYVEGTDYTIVNKTVIFTTAPANGKSIELSRNTYRGQEVTFIEGEDFPAQDYETSLDRLFMIEQEQDKALADETTARIAADVVLQENIDAEADARSAADTVLQGNIDDEVSRAKGVEGSLSNLTTTAKSNLVAAINEVDAHADSISSTIGGYGNIVTHNVSEFATAAQGAKADTAVQPADVGNGTITLTQGGTTKGTFTTNQKTNTTIDLDASGGKCIYLNNQTMTFDVNSGYARLDVSNYVESGVAYCPIVFIGSPEESIVPTATYNVTNKQVSLLRNSTYSSVQKTVTADICLIPVDTNETFVDGLSNGLYYTQYSFINKSDLVTSITSLSTDTQVPSAKCVYNALQGVGGGSMGIYVRDVKATYHSSNNTYYGRIDVSSYIESGKQYFPVVLYINDTGTPARLDVLKNMKSTCFFSKTDSEIELRFYQNTLPADVYYDVYLAEIDDDTNYVVTGLTNGLDGLNIDPQTKANLVTSISSSSTNTQYPSAKCVYDIVGNIETLLQSI